jgi:hypothetical protein
MTTPGKIKKGKKRPHVIDSHPANDRPVFGQKLLKTKPANIVTVTDLRNAGNINNDKAPTIYQKRGSAVHRLCQKLLGPKDKIDTPIKIASRSRVFQDFARHALMTDMFEEGGTVVLDPQEAIDDGISLARKINNRAPNPNQIRVEELVEIPVKDHQGKVVKRLRIRLDAMTQHFEPISDHDVRETYMLFEGKSSRKKLSDDLKKFYHDILETARAVLDIPHITRNDHGRVIHISSVALNDLLLHENPNSFVVSPSEESCPTEKTKFGGESVTKNLVQKILGF